ncbi:MAG: sigma 54-interacting transcriptional regulator [Myxococcota bacterium]
MAETLRQQVSRVRVPSIHVEVVSGPDQGTQATGDRELSVGTAKGNDLVLTDPTVSRYHIQLRRDPKGLLLTDLESTNGTRLGRTQLMTAVLGPGSVLALGDTELRVGEGSEVEVPTHGSNALSGVRGSTEVMRQAMAKAERLAESSTAVLIWGESGTGKELFARALHELGPRRAGPFVTVDCGALSPTLVGSALFGHERGAFTGADRREVGAFEQANGGTILLDEIGELPETLQAALLGVLERGAFRRLGGRSDIRVDVRVVSATHRDLRADVNEGRFRLDLFYRLAVVTLALPPLRKRADDIPLLIEHFLHDLGQQGSVHDFISEASLEELRRHRWPGNVRELRNWVEAALATGEEPALERHLGSSDDGEPLRDLLGLTWKEARGAVTRDFERRYLTKLLERAGDNVSQAARLAEMDRSHLSHLLKRHGLR